MKRWSVLSVTVILLAAPAAAADATTKDAKPEVEIIDEIIAKVNGAIITRSDLERTRRQFIEELRRQKVPEPEIQKRLAEREKHFLRDRIDHLLLVQKGEQLNIDVDQEVSKYFANLMLQFKIADQDKLAELVRQYTGMPFEDYKEEVREGILSQRVLGQEVGSKIVIPREEIEKYYNEHKEEFIREERVFLREILISTEGKEGDELAAAEKKAKEIAQRARNGEKFEELAKEYSDAVTAESGGDLGGWKKGDLLPEIENEIWDKEKNYITDPIKVPNGYLILKVVAHHKAGLALLEEVEQEIMAKLYGPKFEPKVREYLTQLRQEAYLEIKPGYIDTAAAPGKDTTWKDPAKLVPETVTREEVIAKRRRKRFLFIPIPGTKASPKSSTK